MVSLKPSMEEKLRNSFLKLKEDLFYLNQEILGLKEEIKELNTKLASLLNQNKSNEQSNNYPTQIQHIEKFPTDKSANYGLNLQNFHVSIGNKGVPTDSQQISNRQLNELKRTFDNSIIQTDSNINKTENQTIQDISALVQNMKNELSQKFEKLTKQEFLVFSILYTLEQEKKQVTYRDLAQKTNLAESSIRDYISRLERKGIPIIKKKINNKLIFLSLAPELKNLATLDLLSRLNNFYSQ